ncbi:hypothetical protein CR513_58838, partial [Mucuna pruriens]
MASSHPNGECHSVQFVHHSDNDKKKKFFKIKAEYKYGRIVGNYSMLWHKYLGDISKKRMLRLIKRLHKKKLTAKSRKTGVVKREKVLQLTYTCIDYKKTFSPISTKDSFRVMMTLVIYFDLELHQMDMLVMLPLFLALKFVMIDYVVSLVYLRRIILIGFNVKLCNPYETSIQKGEKLANT